MKHDSDILKRIKAYFMRRKSAREAYAFEREMERDSFLYDAVDGLEEMMTSDIQQALDELDDRLDAKNKPILSKVLWLGLAAVAIAVLIIAGFAMQPETSSQPDAAEKAQDNRYSPRQKETRFSELPQQSEADTGINDNKPQDESVEDITEKSPKPLDDKPSKEIKPEPKPTEKPTKETQLAKESQSKNDSSAKEKAEKPEAVTTTPATMEEPEKKEEVAIEPEPSAAEKELSSYKAYLKKNLRKSSGMPSGSVVVSFSLDRSGKPKKLSVEKSLCTACDAEAMRLIQNGPALSAQDRSGRISMEVVFH